MSSRASHAHIRSGACGATHPKCFCRSLSRGATLSDIIADYRRNHAPNGRAELAYYASLSRAEALTRAGNAERPDGKRHDHQRRIPRAVLRRVATKLPTIDIRRASSFEDLHGRLQTALRKIAGVGPLLVYDTALRLGARRNLTPRVIYLHAGTRRGVRALLSGGIPKTIPVELLPAALRRCSPRELEDLLCIFAGALQLVRRQTRSRGR